MEGGWIFFGLRQGGVIFDAEKYKSPAPQAVNSEPSLMYRYVVFGEIERPLNSHNSDHVLSTHGIQYNNLIISINYFLIR